VPYRERDHRISGRFFSAKVPIQKIYLGGLKEILRIAAREPVGTGKG